MYKTNNNKLSLLLKTALLSLSLIIFTTNAFAQNAAVAKRVLDKTAYALNKKGGASASFTVSSPSISSTSGNISIKGRKFHATTAQNTVWFNGKTQWTYTKKTNEVNVSTPNAAKQASMNPYTFINIYKSGYDLSLKDAGQNYKVHLKSQPGKRSIKEMYITVNKTTYIPSQVKMLLNKGWLTINIKDFKAKNMPNSLFIFNSKDVPTAEVVDLR